jgi:short-subunit dehydrogenase
VNPAHDIDPEEFRGRYGSWALVLGASEGTGASFSRRIAELGVNVAMASRRIEPLNELADEIRSATGVEVRTASIDLSSQDAINSAVALTGDVEVGLLVYNAGAEPKRGYVLDRPLEESLKLLGLNAYNPLVFVHHYAAAMVERRRGGILLMGSLASAIGKAHMAMYSATKSYMNRLAEGLWMELGQYNVDVVNYVADLTATAGLLRHKEENDAAGLKTSNFDLSSAALPEDIANEGLEALLHKRGPLRGPGAAPRYDFANKRWLPGDEAAMQAVAEIVRVSNMAFVDRFGLAPLVDPASPAPA